MNFAEYKALKEKLEALEARVAELEANKKPSTLTLPKPKVAA